MDIQRVAAALQRTRTSPAAIEALAQYNNPLSEKEAEQLANFQKERREQLEGGLKVEEVTEDMLHLSQRPLKPYHPLHVVQCIIGAARIPSLPDSCQRTLQKQLLPAVVAKTPLSVAEWGTALTAAAATLLKTPTTRAGVRCVEELLHHSAPVLFGLTVKEAVLKRKEPRKDTTQPRLKAFTEDEAQRLFLVTLAEVVRQYAAIHAAVAKHSRKHTAEGEVHGNEVFLESGPVRRLQRILSEVHAEVPERVQAVLEQGGLLPADAVTLSVCVAQPWSAPIAKENIAAVVKIAPGTLYNVLGARRPVAGSLRLQQPQDAIQLVLYNAGLTSTTPTALKDFVAVLGSIPTEDLAEYISRVGKDSIVALLTPFLTNAKVLTLRIAVDLAPVYGTLLSQLLAKTSSEDARAAVWKAFVEAAVFVVGTRCRSPPEKACILFLLASMAEAVPQRPPVTDSRAELVALLNREVGVPAVESAGEALRLVALMELESDVEAGLNEAVKHAKRNDELRRMLLTHVAPARTSSELQAALVGDLLEECVEVEVARPDAFLALIFAVRDTSKVAQLTKLCPLLCTAEVLAQLGARDVIAAGEDPHVTDIATVAKAIRARQEASRLVETAMALAHGGHYGAVPMLLTHRSGLVRARLTQYVESVSAQASTVISLWESLLKGVVGVQEARKPLILSSTAQPAVMPIIAALLQRSSRVAIDSALVDVLTALGHDNVQGEDPFFFAANSHPHRRYYAEGKRLHTRDTLDLLFPLQSDNVDLLQQHSESVMGVLAERMRSSPEHISIAACRGAVLLMARLTVAGQEAAVTKLADALKASAAFFEALTPMQRAVATESSDEHFRFEEETLKDQHLLKTYPDRPPKGMSEDDFLDMKKKDAVALAKGRDAVQAEWTKQSQQMMPSIHQNKTPFLAVRLMGTNGQFDINCVAQLYPYLQSVVNTTMPKPAAVGQTVSAAAADAAALSPIVLRVLACDAVTGLMARTPLRYLIENMCLTVGRLHAVRTLAVADVSRISLIASQLRMALPSMLPAALFVTLTPFARVAFKAGRGSNAVKTTIPVSTQHQLLSVLVQSLGQTNLPHPTETLQLLSAILQSFPALFKSVQQGVQLLMGMIPASRLSTIEDGLFSTVESVQRVTAACFGKFAHFTSCRRALVLAGVFSDEDEDTTIRNCMTAIIEDPAHPWTLESRDWPSLIYFLETYGTRSEALAKRIALVMKTLFADTTTSEAQQAQWLEDIVRVGGSPAVIAIHTLSPTLHGSTPVKVMAYLCSITETLTSGEWLMRLVMNAGRTLLSDTDVAVLHSMAPELKARLEKPPKESSPNHKEFYLATATVWLTIIGCRLQENALLDDIIDQQTRTLSNSQTSMVHRCVCDSMTEMTKNDHVRQSKNLDDFMEKCMKQVIHSGSYIRKKAHASGMVGVLAGLGLPSLERFHVLETMEQASKGKQAEKSGVMVLMEVLCEVLGTRFEPYALALSPVLLESVADPDPKISECADDAARVMMSSLSGVGLRQLIPRLVSGLSSDVAKRRVPPLNFIGYVAFCSPKQLAATLPAIMKHIIGCLFDVNNTVSTAAYNALRRVAGVVSNPEIQEHVELILNAMRSPSSDTEAALDALLYTRFINVVDPASLALIIPVISRGLNSQNAHTRPKAAQIAAAMVSLVNDPKTLAPYVDDLVQLLKDASQDPSTEARTTAAKAAGVLAAAMGDQLVDDLAQWSFSVMQRVHAGTIEKAGAAQVFVEVVHACGPHLLKVYFETIRSGMTDDRPPVREGFLYIMVYAPSTLDPANFQDFLPLGFPWVLEGLSHFSDKVRDVALVAGDSIIGLYGTRHLDMVVKPLLRGVSSEVTTLRHSSLVLASKLLLHMVSHIKKRMRIQEALATVEGEERAALEQAIAATDPDAVVDDSVIGHSDEAATGILTMENARDVEKRGISILGSLEEMLGTSDMISMLSAVYCGRNEHSTTVRTDCNLAWQACVASIRAAIGKMFDGLVSLLVHFCGSPNPDCVEVAQKTIEFTCRMQEFIDRFVNAFCDNYKENTREGRLGSLNGLVAVVQFADARRLVGMGGQIVGCVLPGMQDSDSEVQEAARQVFARVSKMAGENLIEKAVEEQLKTSVRGVVEVVKVKPTLALSIIFARLQAQTTYTPANLELIDAILDIEEAEGELRKYMETLVKLFLAFLVQNVEDAGTVMSKFVSMMPDEYHELPVEYFQRAANVPSTRHGAVLAAEAFALGTDTENVEGLTAAFRVILGALGDDEEAVRLDAVRIVGDLINSLERRVVQELPEEEQQDVTAAKRVAGRYLLQLLDVFQSTIAVTARASIGSSTPDFAVLAEGDPRLFDTLMNFYNRGLDYGTPQQKVLAVECIRDLMEFAPRVTSASAANTVAGRCSKTLFTRNDGSVVLALVQLCLQLLDYPASGKEKMVEGTMALAMFNAALCDSGEARVLALRVVIQLLRRSEKYADLILGTVVTKKAAVDSPLYRTVLCRFISVVMRYANFEKAFPHVTKLMDIVMPIWTAAETPAQAVAAGVAVGALAKSASIKDDELSEIKERALTATGAKGSAALAGFAIVYSLIVCAPQRTDQSFLDTAAEHLRAAASFGAGDKLATMWMLRAAGALAQSGAVSVDRLKVEVYVPLLRRVADTDEQMMSTAQYFIDSVTAAYPQCAALLENMSADKSSQWLNAGQFDADLDDEVVADIVY